MNRIRWKLMILGLGLLPTLIVGCKSFFAPRGIPQDPLILSRQPIESRGQVTPSPAPTYSEPRVPGTVD